MFYHMMHDIIAISCESNVSEAGLMSAAALNWGDGFELILSIVLAAAAFWLIRDAQREQIREVWDKKWIGSETL
jgi:hypothetical protein